jgi:NADH:ubiquinone oxidoreductase subunit 6 (subunit J)
VNSEITQSQSRLAVVHAVVYATGLLMLVAGVFGEAPLLLLLAGPCLAMSGALIWVGAQITLHGPVGAMLRALLGPSRIASMHLRAAFWVLLGLLVVLWGVVAMRTSSKEQQMPSDPTYSQGVVHAADGCAA